MSRSCSAAWGSFGPKRSPYAAGTAPDSVALGDFNGDSELDLAVANCRQTRSPSCSAARGGSFARRPRAPLLAAGPARLPSATSTATPTPTSQSRTAVPTPSRSCSAAPAAVSAPKRALAPARSRRRSPSVASTPTPNPDLAVANYNSDLAVANYNSDNVSILLGGAGGSFGAQTTFAVGDFPQSVTAGDFNADADPDLAVANANSSNVSILLNTSRPAVSLTPSSLAFGSQLLNTHTDAAQKTVSLTNTGDAHLRIDDVRIRGTAATDFELVAERCTGDLYLVTEGCSVRVAFSPTLVGPRSATLRITDNAPGSPHDIPLSGTGVAPACNGLDATIAGTTGSDTLTGSAGSDIVALLGGDDTFRGGNGNDTVCAGGGDDDVNGQAGVDNLRGGNGDDQLRGDVNNDSLYGGSDDDDLFGGAGTDLCSGGSDTDTADVACETAVGVP